LEAHGVLVDLAGDVLLEDGEEEVLLAGEVRVDRAGGHAGLARDGVDRRAVEAAAGEDADSGFDHPRARERALLLPQGGSHITPVISHNGRYVNNGVWMGVGLVLYFSYGARRSRPAA